MSIQELIKRAQCVRDERRAGMNTACRIGQLLVDIITAITENKGEKGDDASVASQEYDEQGNTIVTWQDGKQTTIQRGQQGEQGIQGERGERGPRGDSAYETFTLKLGEYLHVVKYDALDYDFAKEYFREHYVPMNGSCSVVRKGNKIGRNLDWLYDNEVEFIVESEAGLGRYASKGFAGTIAELTNATMDDAFGGDLAKIVPFRMLDGVNEKGVYASVNMLNNDATRSLADAGTTPLVEERDTICSIMAVRYVLDNFASAQEAVEYIRDYVRVYPPIAEGEKHDVQIVVADKSGTFVLSFEGTQTRVITDEFHGVVTNFRLGGTRLIDGEYRLNGSYIEDLGSGIERANIALGMMESATIDDIMRELHFTHAYDEGSTRYTEFVGLRGTTIHSPIAEFQELQSIARDTFLATDRSKADVWQSVHTIVYDLDAMTASFATQEINDGNSNEGEFIVDATCQRVKALEERADEVDAQLVNKTEKVRVDIVGTTGTYQFKQGEKVLNFADINTLLQETPDFVVFVHGSREHRCVEIINEGNARSMTFLAPTIEGLNVKAQSFKITSADGVAITSIKRTDIVCENKTDADETRKELAKKVGEAPTDGKQYARKDGAWAEAKGGMTPEERETLNDLSSQVGTTGRDFGHYSQLPDVTLTPLYTGKRFNSNGELVDDANWNVGRFGAVERGLLYELFMGGEDKMVLGTALFISHTIEKVGSSNKDIYTPVFSALSTRLPISTYAVLWAGENYTDLLVSYRSDVEGATTMKVAEWGIFKSVATQFANLKAKVDLKSFADGYYQGMRVGIADDLTPIGNATEQEFKEQITGGAQSGTISDGTSVYNVIKGNTQVVDGKLVNMYAEGVKTTGKNLWNEEWESGTINLNTGINAIDNNYIRSAGYIKVAGVSTIRINVTTMGSTNNIYLYDADKNFLSYSSFTGLSTRIKEIPEGCAYVRFAMGGSTQPYTTYASDFCLTADVNFTTYEPYIENTRSWKDTINKYFPDGMRSAGTAYDEITAKKATKSIGVVDMGTLQWIGSNGSFNCNDPRFVGNSLICAKYRRYGSEKSTQGAQNEDEIIFWNVDSGYFVKGALCVLDTTLAGLSANEFRISMKGVLLYYKLAEPEVYEYDELNLSVPVAKGGKEIAIIPEDKESTPLKANITYGMSAAATIKKLVDAAIEHGWTL